MNKMFITFTRWIGLSVASVALLVVIGGGLMALQQYSGVQGDVDAPEVEFNDFKTFKNHVPDVKETADLKKIQDEFFNDFDEKSAIIINNVTAYSKSVKQVDVNVPELEKYLFNLLNKYDYDLKSSYLEQLSDESENLLSYGQEIQNGASYKSIEWTDFLNWFSRDFDAKLNAELDRREAQKSELVSIEASLFTVFVFLGIGFVVLMFLIITVLLLKIESNTRSEDNEVTVDPEDTDTTKAS